MRWQKLLVLGLACFLLLPAVAGCSGAPGSGKAGDGRAAAEKKLEWREITLAEAPAAIQEWVKGNYFVEGTHTRFTAQGAYFLVAWGEKPTGGYRVTIAEVRQGPDGLEVRAVRQAPAPDAAVTQALSYPYALAFAPGVKEQKVTFRVEEVRQVPPPVASSATFRVFEPAPGSIVTVGRPLRIRGQARVFEATFIIELEDGHDVLARRVVTASAGAPAWGDFLVELPFKEPTSPYGTLLFVTESPKDGSRQEELAVTVKFDRFVPLGN